MTPERWKRLAELFESALQHEPVRRAGFLAGACADDELLRSEVEELLQSHEQAGSFGTAPAFHVAAVAGSTSSAGTLDLGSRLGRYEIVSLLGAGGMGEVYRARDPQLGREVGIKILPGRGEITSDQIKRFEREARAVGALNHSNILAVYDIGVERDIPYVVSELLEGETLRSRLNAGRLPVETAVDIALQIVSGLTAAHDKGVVHRDIKPENLFVTREGLVKILDFGLATRTVGFPATHGAGVSISEQGLLLGTAGYMAPEQVRGQKTDARSDVFAFGAVLYEMLTGRRAFTGDSVVETMNAILTSEPPPITAEREVPEPLCRIVQQCLEKNLEQRFSSARAVGTALDGVRDSLTTSSRVLGPAKAGHSVRGGTREPAGTYVVSAFRRTGSPWRLIAAILLVAAVTITALSFMGWRRPPRPGGSGRPALAVMPLEDHSGDPKVAWLAEGLPRMLVTSLAQTPGLDVIGSERLQASFKELGRDRADPSARGLVARHAGAGAVLAGSLFKSGSDIRVDVQVEDVETGRVVVAGSEQGQDVFALVDALTVRIRAALDVKDRPAGRPLRDVTTGSLVAYELYVKGLEAWHNRRWGDARTIFEEAVRIDPAFALAHAQLAIVLERLGESGKAVAHREQVMSQLDRLPERHRLLAEAKHESVTNLPRAREILERLLERYPDEEEAYDLMVHAYTYTPDTTYWKQTLGFMQRWERAIPGPGSGHFHNHYGYTLIDHGLYTEAEREFRAYIRVSPDEANPYDSLAELFLMTGRPDEAIAHYDQALRLNPLFGNSYLGRAYAHAMRGRYDEAVASLSKLQELGPRAGLSAASIHVMNAFIRSRAGRYREADEHLASAARLARESGDTAGEAASYLFEALLAFERRQMARTLEAVRRTRHASESVSPAFIGKRHDGLASLIGGTVEAQNGRVEAARAHLVAVRGLEAGSDANYLAVQQALAGEIALAAGDLAAAGAAFESTAFKISSFSIFPALATIVNHLPFRDGLARAAAARGDLRTAMEMYRRLNQPDITARWTSVLEPRFVLAGARLANRAGDRETARAEYMRFLELWRNADDGLPELAEARKYLTGPGR